MCVFGAHLGSCKDYFKKNYFPRQNTKIIRRRFDTPSPFLLPSNFICSAHSKNSTPHQQWRSVALQSPQPYLNSNPLLLPHLFLSLTLFSFNQTTLIPPTDSSLLTNYQILPANSLSSNLNLQDFPLYSQLRLHRPRQPMRKTNFRLTSWSQKRKSPIPE